MDFKTVIASGLVLATLATVSCSKAEQPAPVKPAPVVVEPVVEAPVIEAPVVEEAPIVDRVVITNAEECTTEGGTVFEGFCIVPVRPEEYQGEEYDNAGLGVISCSGQLVNNDEFCRIELK